MVENSRGLPAATSLSDLRLCSWSGGKDSALAYHRASERGAQIGCLITMMTDSGARSRSHGLRADVLQAQADCMGVRLEYVPSSWDTYEERFLNTLTGLASEGYSHGVFGDIDFERNRRWAETICERAQLRAEEPLWEESRLSLLEEFLELGFRAMIVAVGDRFLPPDFLGRDLDWALVEEVRRLGCDPSGENGEYHTVVYEGPIFSDTLCLEPGTVVSRDGYHALDYRLATERADFDVSG